MCLVHQYLLFFFSHVQLMLNSLLLSYYSTVFFFLAIYQLSDPLPSLPNSFFHLHSFQLPVKPKKPYCVSIFVYVLSNFSVFMQLLTTFFNLSYFIFTFYIPPLTFCSCEDQSLLYIYSTVYYVIL
jgi:hypothetical protein